MKKVTTILLVLVLSLVVAVPAFAAPVGGRHASNGIIYVTSQGLYYDVITPIAPGQNGVPWNPNQMNRPFQQLIRPGEPGHSGSAYPETEFGPGPGYAGGRWWIDEAPFNGYQDAGDTFFICPLLGPGRTTP